MSCGPERAHAVGVDLVNHCTNISNNYAMAQESRHVKYFELRTPSYWAHGDSLCINYGNHTSMQFFLFYGFVPRSQGPSLINVGPSAVVSQL